ncbi:MAG: tRNA (adenosine(37)-N6)-dimethylallyltransferase MiaA [Peptococcaceae bacterium]|nr:tRNA (adenosine(37)-N6)-dimethylallyltransferase MiaA [Peptococcaceae bacterium]
MERILALIGPTATGKTALSVRLAEELGGEIISGDSMQIYRGLDIGTAKITPAEARGIPHYLIDSREHWESFTVADYQRLAREKIADIASRGKRPILAGGSGLYLYGALYNYTFRPENTAGAEPTFGSGTAGALAKTAGAVEGVDGTTEPPVTLGAAPVEPIAPLGAVEPPPASGDELWRRLRAVDPVTADRLHPHDQKRARRALAYYQLHGEPISRNNQALAAPELVLPTLLLGLYLPRPLLYNRIDRRVDQMLDDGLVAEVKRLRAAGLTRDSQAGQAIGYKRLLDYLDGAGGSLAETAELIKRDSRRYAKRQLTWFRRDDRILWLDGERMATEAGREILLNGIGRSEREGWDLAALAQYLQAAGLISSKERA